MVTVAFLTGLTLLGMATLAVATVYALRKSDAALILATQDLADAERRAADALAEVSRAHAEKREAQRILAILSEPLKDWDLADFVGIYANTSEGRQHLRAIRDAYRIVAADAARARMSVTVNDRARRRGWDDEPTASPPRPAAPRRNLP